MKKLMKKLLAAIGIFTAMTLLLVACKPEDMGSKFYNQAYAIFTEIDDDTMELEISDNDDLRNLDLLVADSESEKSTYQALENIVKLQPKVIDGDKESIKQYLLQRDKFYDAMGYGSLSRTEFSFKEGGY